MSCNTSESRCGNANGKEYSSAPKDGLCEEGNATQVKQDGSYWVWSCRAMNNQSEFGCKAKKIDTVAKCGSSNRGSFSSAPTTGLCSSGTASDVTEDGPWFWTCKGVGGGKDVSCYSNNKLSDSGCGTSARTYGVNETAFTGSFCLSENPFPSSPAFPGLGETTTWMCPQGAKEPLAWSPITISKKNCSWDSVTYGNGLFVAVPWWSNKEGVATSPDGFNWTIRPLPEDIWLTSITYRNGLFVAVAYDGTHKVMTSPDGINWTGRKSPEGNWWRSVTYGNGLFVAVGKGGDGIMTSLDGINWTPVKISNISTSREITYGNGLFVVVGGIRKNDYILTSSDGVNWKELEQLNVVLDAITYGNGRFVSVGYNDSAMISSTTAMQCRAKREVSINAGGQCGPSHNKILSSKPTSGLCNSGTASPVSNSIPWKWTCNNGSLTVSCEAYKMVVGGQCGTSHGQGFVSQPTTGLCATGKAVRVAASDNGWTWTCESDTSVSCSASKIKEGCGSANGTVSSTAPITGMCLINKDKRIVENDADGNWVWTCGEEVCHATDPNREYKKRFGSSEMSEYSGDPMDPTSTTVYVPSYHCNWLPSGSVYKNYKKVSCKYEEVGTHGACEDCSVGKFVLEKK